MTIPYHLEEYSVPSRRLTDAEMEWAARRVGVAAISVYREDKGIWKTFVEFLAFRIGVESIEYVYGDREDMERFAVAVRKHAEWLTPKITRLVFAT